MKSGVVSLKLLLVGLLSFPILGYALSPGAATPCAEEASPSAAVEGTVNNLSCDPATRALRVSGTFTSSGGATAAKQDTGNASLAAINADLDSIAANAITTVTNTGTTATGIGAPADAAWSGSGNGALIAIEKSVYAKVEAVRALLAGTLTVGLPSGASTESTLSALNGKVPSQGQALAASSTPVVLPAAQASLLAQDTSVATTKTNLGAPGATACATDTGSCALNALLQRIAQRITSMIAALGSPFQAGGSIGNTSFASTQSGTWTVQPGNTANTTPWLATDTSDAAVTPGTVATKSSLAGVQYNATLPAPADT